MDKWITLQAIHLSTGTTTTISLGNTNSEAITTTSVTLNIDAIRNPVGFSVQRQRRFYDGQTRGMLQARAKK